MDELPCAQCDGWMTLTTGRWTCPDCGFQSDEGEEVDLSPPTVPGAAPSEDPTL